MSCKNCHLKQEDNTEEELQEWCKKMERVTFENKEQHFGENDFTKDDFNPNGFLKLPDGLGIGCGWQVARVEVVR